MISIRTFITTVIFVALAYTMYSQPRLKVQPEVDWGTVVPNGPTTQQQRVETKLSLKNIGDATLQIRSVRPSCGCVTAPLERDSIAPNEEIFIDVTMNMPVANGPLRKTLTIQTNEPIDSMHAIVLKVELARSIQLSSSFIPFNKGRAGEIVEGEITITSFAGEDIGMTVVALVDRLTVSSPNPLVLTKAKPETIHFEYKPLVAGAYQLDLELRTTLAGYEAIPISGFGVAEVPVK